MPARYPIQKILSKSQRIQAMWALTPALDMPGHTLEEFKALTETLQRLIEEIAQLECHLIAKRHELNCLANEISEQCMRLRSRTRAYFGPDSIEVKMVGLTRRSDRKPRRRKNAG